MRSRLWRWKISLRRYIMGEEELTSTYKLYQCYGNPIKSGVEFDRSYPKFHMLWVLAEIRCILRYSSLSYSIRDQYQESPRFTRLVTERWKAYWPCRLFIRSVLILNYGIFQSRVEEGKPKMSVINMIRNRCWQGICNGGERQTLCGLSKICCLKKKVKNTCFLPWNAAKRSKGATFAKNHTLVLFR